MKTEKTSLDGVMIVEPDFRFEDERGETVCTLEDEFGRWKKHNFSVSYKNVLRGIHVSPNRAKLAYCPFGSIYAVVVDCRPEAKTYGQWLAVDLDNVNRRMIYVPPMFGLAHCIKSDIAIFQYHWTGTFDGDEQISYYYKSFGISWPIENPILSQRDKDATLICYDGTAIMSAEQLGKMADEDRR